MAFEFDSPKSPTNHFESTAHKWYSNRHWPGGEVGESIWERLSPEILDRSVTWTSEVPWPGGEVGESIWERLSPEGLD